MAERTIVVDHLKYSYEGLFNAGEVFAIISSWFYERNWDWIESLNEEQVTPEGKQIRILLYPWKSEAESYRFTMKIKLHMLDVKDVEVEHEGQVLKLNQGLIRMTFDAHVWTDRREEWTEHPLGWFIHIMMHRYFFKNHMKKYKDWIKSDVDEILNHVKSYLNKYKYVYQM